MTTYPGDPLTPDVGATPDARRLTRAKRRPSSRSRRFRSPTPTRRKIIAALKGPVVTGRQRGGLGIAYHWGGTDAVKVHLAVKSDWSLKPVYDVIAMLHGSDLSRPVDRPRQPPRRLGVRRRRSAHRPGRADERGQGARPALPQGWRPGADDRLRQLGRRGAGAARLDRMGRNPRRRAQAQGGPLHQHRQKRPRLPAAEGNHELQHFVNQAASDVPIRRPAFPVRSAAAPRSSPAAITDPDDVDADVSSTPPRPAATCRRAARLGLRLHRLRSSTSASPSINLGFGGEDLVGRQLSLGLRQLIIT